MLHPLSQKKILEDFCLHANQSCCSSSTVFPVHLTNSGDFGKFKHLGSIFIFILGNTFLVELEYSHAKERTAQFVKLLFKPSND
jgi:hypothetical protein